MIGWIVAALLAVIAVSFVAYFWPRRPEVLTDPPAPAEDRSPASIVDPKTRSEIENTEREVFAKADLIQKIVQGMIPSDGTSRSSTPTHPVDPDKQPPDETGFMKAITDKVEQIKRLSKTPKIG